MKKMKKKMISQQGNALFLILIAVALFAALSYAVTQSGRGGSGVDKEQALISASEMTQYGASLRTTVLRMILTGTDENALDFTNDGTDEEDEVFNTLGGGSTEQDPPNASGATAYTYLVPTSSTSGHYIDGIGSVAPEVMVVADGLSVNVCQEANRGLGLDVVPLQETATVVLATAGAASGATTFDSNSGEPFACVDNDSTAAVDFTYYHALVEQ